MKKLMVTLGVLFAMVWTAAAAAPTVESYAAPKLISEINTALSTLYTGSLTNSANTVVINNLTVRTNATVSGTATIGTIAGNGTSVTNINPASIANPTGGTWWSGAITNAGVGGTSSNILWYYRGWVTNVTYLP